MCNKFVTSDASLVLLASSSQCKPFLRDQVCHINYMIGKIFYNQFVTIWCGSPNASAQRSSRSPSFTPYLPVTVAPNCSPPPSRVPSTLPAVVKMLPLTDPSLIPGPKDSQMHSFDFSVLTESSLCKVLLTPLSDSDGKDSACNAGDSGLTPWVGKISLGEGEWLPTPVCLPGEFHGQRKLVGHRPQGSKGLDTTENSTFLFTWCFI